MNDTLLSTSSTVFVQRAPVLDGDAMFAVSRDPDTGRYILTLSDSAPGPLADVLRALAGRS